MRLLLLTSLSAALLLSACGPKEPPAPTVLATSPTGTVWELPVAQEKEKEIAPTPGKDPEDVVAVVVVPPSATPTTVKIYDRPKPLKKRIKEAVTGNRNSPEVAAVSDNKAVTVTSARETGIWPWLAGFAVIIGGLIAARRWLKRFGWIVKVLGWVRKLIGL